MDGQSAWAGSSGISELYSIPVQGSTTPMRMMSHQSPWKLSYQNIGNEYFKRHIWAKTLSVVHNRMLVQLQYEQTNSQIPEG